MLAHEENNMFYPCAWLPAFVCSMQVFGACSNVQKRTLSYIGGEITIIEPHEGELRESSAR